MNKPVHRFLFDYSGWIIPLVAAVGIPVIVILSKPENVAGNLIALLGGAFAAVYAIQKQQIEGLQLFQQLFTHFNARYAELHHRLQCVVNGPETDDGNIREVLDNYFNLCAEEYRFYKEGRILGEVWRAWCRGILAYLACDRIRSYWETEVTHDSYYGLTTEEICRGAALSERERRDHPICNPGPTP